MKSTKSILLLNVVLAAFACLASVSTAFGQSCSCSAPDGSCSASVTCSSGGCMAICSSGNCSARCTGRGGGDVPVDEGPSNIIYFNRDGAKVAKDKAASLQLIPTQESRQYVLRTLNKTITVDSRNQSAESLLAAIAGKTKSDISFNPVNPNERIDADFKGALVWDVIESLSGKGTIIIDGENIAPLLNTRKALLGNQRVNICITGMSATRAFEELGLFVSIPYRVDRDSLGNAETKITRQLKDVTLSDILGEISREANVNLVP